MDNREAGKAISDLEVEMLEFLTKELVTIYFAPLANPPLLIAPLILLKNGVVSAQIFRKVLFLGRRVANVHGCGIGFVKDPVYPVGFYTFVPAGADTAKLYKVLENASLTLNGLILPLFADDYAARLDQTRVAVLHTAAMAKESMQAPDDDPWE